MYLGSAYSGLERYKDALIELKKSYELKKNDQIRYFLAFVSFEMKDVDSSILWIKKIKNKSLWVGRIKRDFAKVGYSEKLNSFLENIKY